MLSSQLFGPSSQSWKKKPDTSIYTVLVLSTEPEFDNICGLSKNWAALLSLTSAVNPVLSLPLPEPSKAALLPSEPGTGYGRT